MPDVTAGYGRLSDLNAFFENFQSSFISLIVCYGCNKFTLNSQKEYSDMEKDGNLIQNFQVDLRLKLKSERKIHISNC